MSKPQPGFRVTKLWAFLAVGDDDEEGVAGMLGPDGWVPFIAADQNRLESLRPAAQDIANRSGKTIRLVRFDHRTDLEIIVPQPRKGAS